MLDMDTNDSVLLVHAYDGRQSLTLLSVSRDRDRLFYLRLGLIVPEWRAVPLSLIAAVQVTKRERDNDQHHYGVSLRVVQGDHIKFGCSSREQAMAIRHKIATYLGLSRPASLSFSASPLGHGSSR